MNQGITELWHNQREFIKGLRSAEFNLRAHQKAMNAVAAELDLIHRTLMPAGVESVLQIRGVEQEDKSIARRIDWGYYHAQVEEEMKALKDEQKSEPEEQPPVDELQAKEDAEFPEGASIFG